MADEEVVGSGRVEITIDTSRADDSLDTLARDIERTLDRAARQSARRVERRLERAFRRLRTAAGAIEISVTPSLDRDTFIRAVQSQLLGATVAIGVTPMVDRTTFVQGVQNQLLGATVSIGVTPDVNSRGADRDSGRLSSSLLSVGKAAAGIAKVTLALGALSIAAAGAVVAVGGLLAALAPAVGIIAAGPAVILGFAGALAGLKIALSGVGDAFGAALGDDAEAFEEALKGLSPAAQNAAREVRALKPQFDALKTSVQEGFFSRIEGEISKTGEALLGPLTNGLTTVAEGWGRAANAALEYIRGAQGVSNIKDILTASGLAVDGLAVGTNRLTAGFLQAAAAVAKAFGPQVQSGLTSLTTKFGTFLQESAGDGRLVAWVNEALNVFAQLGDLVSSIGGLLSGLVRAANEAGGGLLGNLQSVVGSLEDFAQSAAGQEALVNVFRTLAGVAAQLGPILGALITQLGGILPAFAPLLESIGPAITGVINALGPAIQNLMPGITSVVNGVVKALDSITSSGALEVLGTAFSNVLTAVSPLLPLIGELAASIGTILGTALSELAVALTPVIKELTNALLPVLPTLTDAVMTLVVAFAPLLNTLGTALVTVIQAVTPLLPVLADAFTRIAVAVAPLITEIADQLLPILTPLIDAFIAVLDALIPLVEPVVALIEALAPLVILILKAQGVVSVFQAKILKWLSINVVVPIIEGVSGVIIGLIDAVTKAVRVITAFPGKAKEALSTFGNQVGSAIQNGNERFSSAVSEGISENLALLRSFVGRIKSALSGLGSAMYNIGRQMMQGMVNGIKSMIGSLTDAARSAVKGAVDSAKGFLGIASPSKVFRDIGRFAMDGLVLGVDQRTRAVRSAALGASAALSGPFGGLGAPGTGGSVNGAQRGAQGRTVNNTFNITEVGSGEATAQRVINRMVLASGVL